MERLRVDEPDNDYQWIVPEIMRPVVAESNLNALEEAGSGYGMYGNQLPDPEEGSVVVERGTIEQPGFVSQEVAESEENPLTQFNNDNLHLFPEKERQAIADQCAETSKQLEDWVVRDLRDEDRNNILKQNITDLDSAIGVVQSLLDFENVPNLGMAGEEMNKIIMQMAMEILGTAAASENKQDQSDHIMKVFETHLARLEKGTVEGAGEGVVAPADEIQQLRLSIVDKAKSQVGGYWDARRRGVATAADPDLDFEALAENFDAIFSIEAPPEVSRRDSYIYGMQKLQGVMIISGSLIEEYENSGASPDLIKALSRLKKEGVIPAEGTTEQSIEILKKRMKTMGKKLQSYEEEYTAYSSPHLQFQKTAVYLFDQYVGHSEGKFKSYDQVHALVQDVISKPYKYTHDEALMVMDTWLSVYGAFKTQLSSGKTTDAVGKRLFNIRTAWEQGTRGGNVSNSWFALFRGEDNALLQQDPSGRVAQAGQNLLNTVLSEVLEEYKAVTGIEEDLSQETVAGLTGLFSSMFKINATDGIIDFNQDLINKDPVLTSAVLGVFLSRMEKQDLSGIPVIIKHIAENIEDGLNLLDDPEALQKLTGTSEESEDIRRRALTALASALSLSNVPPSARDTMERGLGFKEGVFDKLMMLRSLLDTPSTYGEAFFGNAFNAIAESAKNPAIAGEMISALQERMGNVVRGVVRSLTDPGDITPQNTRDLRSELIKLQSLPRTPSEVSSTSPVYDDAEAIDASYKELSKLFALPEDEDDQLLLFEGTVARLGGAEKIFTAENYEALKKEPKHGLLLLVSMASTEEAFQANLPLYAEAYYEGGDQFRPSKLPFEDIFSLTTFLGRGQTRFFNGELIGTGGRVQESILTAGMKEAGTTSEKIDNALKISRVRFSEVRRNFSAASEIPEIRLYNEGLMTSLGFSTEEEYRQAVEAAITKVEKNYRAAVRDRVNFAKKYGHVPRHSDVMFNIMHELVANRAQSDWSYRGLTKSMLGGRYGESGIRMYPTTLTPSLRPSVDGKVGGMDMLEHINSDNTRTTISIPLILYFDGFPRTSTAVEENLKERNPLSGRRTGEALIYKQ